ncbi:MAG: transcription antitermination factor NusB [Burkholderiales bacterium]|nr:MAG: transcription antitermination factor NusB [Burkholderiales bacterium]
MNPGRGGTVDAPARGRGARSGRRRARELALQGVYQWLLSGEDTGAIEAQLIESPGFERVDRAHFSELLHGAIREADRLHASMEPHLDRDLRQLSPVEHAALLIGCYELLRHLEIPYRVVINEAVELSKSFGGTEGYRYVNGVLDKVAARLRTAEIGAR